MKPYTILFEHTVSGLIEHSMPLVREWIRSGHRALIMAPESELNKVQAAYKDLPFPDQADFQSFGRDLIKWRDLHAMINVTLSESGPAFRDPHTRFNIPRVALNHGLTDKLTTFPAAFLGNGVGYNNVLFACGPAMFKGSWETYVQKWPEILSSLKIVPIGSPKTDALFDGTFKRQTVLESLGLDPCRPTVLYAPTYQREASLEQAGEAIIEALASLEINLLVRPHHLSTTPRNTHADGSRKNWRAILQALAQNHPNLRFVEGDSNPYFVAADLLVGDASGACYEYILQDKPVVFYDVPAFFEAHGRCGVGFWGRAAGTIAANPEELRAAVLAELASPGRRADARQKLISQLVYKPGNACQRAVTALVDLIEGRIEYPIWGPRQNVRQDTLLHAYMLERLERCALETKAIALFGAGAHTPLLLNIMNAALRDGRRMPRVAYVLDDRANAKTPPLMGIPVVQPTLDLASSFDAIILSTDYHQQALSRRCQAVFGSTMPVIDLYAPFPWHRPGADANLGPEPG